MGYFMRGLVNLLILSMEVLAAVSVAAGVRPSEIHQVPAIYVLGDSTLDVGNNNFLPGKDVFRANLSYYGIDLPHPRPTGRFSNGYNIADFIAKSMGFKTSPPAYLSLIADTRHHVMKYLRGVSYASAGAGILDTTHPGRAIPLSKQVEYFAATKAKMEAKLGPNKLNELLCKSFFLIGVGSNDLFAFASQNNSATNHDVATFYTNLLTNYTATITALYKMGARKFGILNVGPVGCVPSARVLNPNGACVDSMNKLATGFNAALKALLGSLGSKLQGLSYSLADSYALTTNILANAMQAGFVNTNSACCGGGRLGAESNCMPNSTICANRNQYIFWDRVHVTQHSAKLGASAFYNGPVQFTTPINFKQLIEKY